MVNFFRGIIKSPQTSTDANTKSVKKGASAKTKPKEAAPSVSAQRTGSAPPKMENIPQEVTASPTDAAKEAARALKKTQVAEDLKKYGVDITPDQLDKIDKKFQEMRKNLRSKAVRSEKKKTSEEIEIEGVSVGGKRKFKIKMVVSTDNTYETYIKVKTLGQGAMGKVSLALSLNRMELLAQKSSKLRAMDLRSASKEIDVIKDAERKRGGEIPGLIHYHAVSYYDSSRATGKTKQRLFMKLCDVGEMTKLVQGKVVVTPKEFCEIASTAFDGLDALHSTEPRTVHGDIKRENILIRTEKDPKNPTAPPKKIGVVIDAQGAFKPEKGGALGTHTIYYVAPEALMASLFAKTGLPTPPPPLPDTPYDVWGMGCTLYESATGTSVPWAEHLDVLDDIVSFNPFDPQSAQRRTFDIKTLEALKNKLETSSVPDQIKKPLQESIENALQALKNNTIPDRNMVVGLWQNYKPYLDIVVGEFQDDLSKRAANDPRLEPLVKTFDPDPIKRCTAKEASLAFKTKAGTSLEILGGTSR